MTHVRGRLGRGALWVGAGLVVTVSLVAVLTTVGAAYHLHFGRAGLPDPGPFTRFAFPAIGYVYDRHGQPLVALAQEQRYITPYADIPPVVRDAIVAAEDKRFFAHNGVDYFSLPRVVTKVRVGAWGRWLAAGPSRDNTLGRAVFPQGGSTITQQLVRGVFLQHQTSQENSYELRQAGLLPRALASAMGARNVNMALRKQEEIRLALWIESRMRAQFGSKRRAKEEILARYASFVYLGNGQYGFARAAEHYFGRPLASFTAADAGLAAMLAGIAKSPRAYAPTAADPAPVLRRRNQILALMAAQGFVSRAQQAAAAGQPLPAVSQAPPPLPSSAVVDHVLDELRAADVGLGLDDLLQGDIHVHATVDAGVQRIASDALEHGLARYERRHPRVKGQVQGSVVVLSNRDASILAEVGGRQVYQGRATSYGDFNRARRSMRQPGSAMKPIVYLAAFRSGKFTLDTLVPDEPISVPDGGPDTLKWIANYDGQFKGLMPLREAFAESRNAVAIWITQQVGITSVLRAARSLGVQTPLQRYATTALGASEVNLLELATAYRTIASGVRATPHVIQRVERRSGGVVPGIGPLPPPASEADEALALIQEGLRGVVRIPTGTAHALSGRAFPVAVMGKTGTTSEFRDALFVGSTYGEGGITVAVRIGFDDNRSLGVKETGGRVAMPVFQEVMLQAYAAGLVGPAPVFPPLMEARITRYLDERATARQPALTDESRARVADATTPRPQR